MDKQRTVAGLDVHKAWTASRKRNCFFSNFSYVQCTQKRKSKMKIQVAIARKVLVSVWHMLSRGEDFIDVYLKRIEKEAEIQHRIHELELTMVS